ncbi:MAG TPA: nucleoside hydrolase [Planctomycetaceae bacterium]|nr:nucleoside hydrolase [Planctomycetaceae bacterium]
MPQKLIIDADPGIGDAVAIALALFDPEIDLIGLTATSGCVTGRTATRNVQAIVETLDPPKWPRIGGLMSDIPVEAPPLDPVGEIVMRINGPGGLGDLDVQVADLHNIRDPARVLSELVKAAPNEITLLTLGPLTNVERACDRNPEFLPSLKRLICLGGAVDGGGDVTASAELNIYCNPEAARNVLRVPATKSLIPLEIGRQVVLTVDQIHKLTNDESRRGKFLKSMLTYAFRAYHEHLGREGFPLREVVALAAVSRPELFESRRIAVEVEVSGELTRGMTVADRRLTTPVHRLNMEVPVRVSEPGVLDYFHRTFELIVR